MYIISCRLYVGVITILNPTPDLTNFQTHACKVPRIYPKLHNLLYATHNTQARPWQPPSTVIEVISSTHISFTQFKWSVRFYWVFYRKIYLTKLPARSKQVCWASEERATLSMHTKMKILHLDNSVMAPVSWKSSLCDGFSLGNAVRDGSIFKCSGTQNNDGYGFIP